MRIDSPPRRTAAVLTALALATGSLLLPVEAAAAGDLAPGTRIIAGVHADVVSTFLDGGKLTLGSKADLPEGMATRLAPDKVAFHLEQASKRTVPAGFEFIAPVGSTIWMAPEVNPGAGIGKIWPGFNTESVAPGAIEGDRTTLTLKSFEGPGNLELFLGGGFEAPERLWSSKDASRRTFTIGRTHMHANWAFTAAGTYRLSVEATAKVAGIPQSASATYTFVVGDLPSPKPVEAKTTVKASAGSVTYGKTRKVSVTVSPSKAKGSVSVKAGSKTVKANLKSGKATLELPAKSLKPGTHALTVSYAGQKGAFKASSAKVTVKVAKAKPSVKVSGPKSVKRGKSATFTVSVSAPSKITPSGSVTVKVAGSSKTVKLDKKGKATVKVSLSKKAKTGSQKVSASYKGNTYLSSAKAKTIKTTVKK